jgi:hypothetical protein
MKFTLKLIAIAALAASSATSFAAIQDATTGNGELVANFRLYSADSDNNNGGNDISALFDLGVSMDSFLSVANVAGYTRTWDLTASNYGNAWSVLTNFDSARNAAIEYNVIALDNNSADAGGNRYLTTASVTTSVFPSLVNQNLIGFQDMNQLLAANQSRGTHGTQADGASTATSSDASNTYFGKVNGSGDGDSWLGLTSADTTKTLNLEQRFFLLSNSSTSTTAQTTKTPFAVDVDGTGTFQAGEFGKWSVNAAQGTITFTAVTAPVPEAETYAMLLAGLGLMGAIVRRRNSKAA